MIHKVNSYDKMKLEKSFYDLIKQLTQIEKKFASQINSQITSELIEYQEFIMTKYQWFDYTLKE